MQGRTSADHGWGQRLKKKINIKSDIVRTDLDKEFS